MSSLWPLAYGYGQSMPTPAPSSATTTAQQAREATASLEERLSKLTLINIAMWELIRQKTNLTELDLLEKVQEVDLRDGVPDGKVTRTVSKCPKCNRTMSPKHNRCLYCGHEKLIDTAFDTL